MTRVALTVRSIVGRARGAVRRGALVSLSAWGQIGMGEASPLPDRSRESLEEVFAALARIGPRFTIDLARPMDATDPGLPASLRFALESASARLAQRLAGMSAPPPNLETQVLGDDLTSIELELRALAAGARSFKLKIQSAHDTRRVLRLRELAPDARIRVDANRAFARPEDVPWDLLAAAGVEWIEEPTPDACRLAATPVPIALDESIVDEPDRAIEAIRCGRVAAIVLKPTLLGVRGVLALSTAAHAHGVRTVLSHAFESEVGLRAAQELARSIAPDECHGLARWQGIESFVLEEPLGAASISSRSSSRSL